MTYYVYLMSSVILMASSFVAAKSLLMAGAPPTGLAATRFIVAGILAVIFLALRRSLQAPKSARELFGVSLIGALQTAVLFGTGFLAMRHLSAATVALFTLTMPLWVVLFDSVLNKKPPGTPTLVGIFLGIVGVGLVVQDGISIVGLSFFKWYLLPLAGAVSWACATIYTKRSALPLSGWSLNAWQMLIGGLVLALLSWLLALPVLHLSSLSDWLWFGWLVVPGSIVSFGLWFAALNIGGATVTSGYLFLVPFFTALLSVPILDARFSASQLVGGIAVGLAVWLISRQPSPSGD